ncbi:MAG: hypothetical protein ACKOOC_10415 [Cyanobium sp.]
MLQANAIDGPHMDVVMDCASALETYVCFLTRSFSAEQLVEPLLRANTTQEITSRLTARAFTAIAPPSGGQPCGR